MAWDQEKDLQLKYQYVDGENPMPYKKFKKKKKYQKSNHKHDYQNCVIEFTYPNNYGIPKLNGTKGYIFGSCCTVCGKISSPVITEEIKKKFPLIRSGYIYAFPVSEEGCKQKEEFNQWFYDHYPHYFADGYWEKGFSGYVQL